MVDIIHLEDKTPWDDYLASNDRSNAYHCSKWQEIITRTYGYKCYTLAAVKNSGQRKADNSKAGLKGILPLVHMRTPLFGNRLVSMPYVDHGGIVADNSECEAKLIRAALDLGKKLKAQRIELRHLHKIASLESCRSPGVPESEPHSETPYPEYTLRTHKQRLLMPLPNTSEELMKSFKSKLRSQINRPIKAGLSAKTGGLDRMDDFYSVFSINMRDLGSPVHSKTLLVNVLEHFQQKAKAVVVYKAAQPVAGGLIIGFKDVMINPWASSLKKHRKESPNMLLYWKMLAYAADHGYRHFDFGRSSPDEGTHRFKTQWGAKPHPMYWYTLWPNPTAKPTAQNPENKKKSLPATLWQKLPVPLTKLIGPKIRKQIDL